MPGSSDGSHATGKQGRLKTAGGGALPFLASSFDDLGSRSLALATAAPHVADGPSLRQFLN